MSKNKLRRGSDLECSGERYLKAHGHDQTLTSLAFHIAAVDKGEIVLKIALRSVVLLASHGGTESSREK